MAQIRRNHGQVLTRLGFLPSGDWAVQLPKLAVQIDELGSTTPAALFRFRGHSLAVGRT